MARMVKIALAQVPVGWPGYPQDGDPAEVHEFHRQELDPFIAEAAGEGADIICFCENALGYGNQAPVSDAGAYEDVLNGPCFEWASGHARACRMNLIMPIKGQHRGAIRNVAVVIDRDGNAVGVYEKVHLTSGEREKGLVAGSNWPVFRLDFGRIGIMICHDMEFPESARCLALNGAEIIFWPTHWGNSAGDNWVWSIVQGTAALNGIYIATVSLAPREGTFWVSSGFIARTGVIGPQGEWRFSVGFEPGLAVGRIDLDAPVVRRWHGENKDFRPSHLADRRPDTYGRLIEPTRPNNG